MRPFLLWSLVFVQFFAVLTVLELWSEEQSYWTEYAVGKIYYDGCVMAGAGYEPETGITEDCEKWAKLYRKVWED